MIKKLIVIIVTTTLTTTAVQAEISIMSSRLGYDIGARSRGSWSKITGSICNGFSASPQFKIAPISAAKDRPKFLDTEAYIAHSLPYLAALTRLETDRDRYANAEQRTERDSQ